MITREQARELLAEVELFRDLSEEDLRRLAALAREEAYSRDDPIWHQGELGTTFYVVVEGQVGAQVMDEHGVEHLERRLGPGDAFGETSLLTGETHEATMVALTDCTLLSIPKTEFDELIRRRKGMARRLRMREDVRRKYETPHFGWLESGEVPTLFCRRHPAYAFWRSIVPILLMAGGLLILSVGQGGGLDWVLAGIGLVLVVGGGFWLLWALVDWRNDSFTVTNRRVVQWEKVLLVSEVRTEAPLERIQDVRVVVRGPIYHIFGVGDIVVETAGATGLIRFNFVARPDEVKEEIFNRIRRQRALKRAATRGEIRRELERRLGGEAEEEPEAPGAEEEAEEARRPSAFEQARERVGYFIPRFREEKNGVVTWRKHWWILAKKVGLQTLLMVLLLVIVGWLTPEGLVCLPIGGLWVVLAGLWLYMYADWRNDVYQIAGDRIVDMTRRPLWGREVRKEGELSNIQNVTYRVGGFINHMLNVGDVVIETAGRTENFEFIGVYKPREVANEIWRRLARQQRKQEQKERERERQTLGEWFEEYDRLVRGGGEAAGPGSG